IGRMCGPCRSPNPAMWVRGTSEIDRLSPGSPGGDFLRLREEEITAGHESRSRGVGGGTWSPTWYMRGGPQSAASGVVNLQSATVCSGLEALRSDKALWDPVPAATG